MSMSNDIPELWPVAPGIVAIDTGYLRPRLDASHLVIDQGRAAFVDTGTNDSVPRLLAALAGSGLEPGDVDYVFLTHVHLDHAGGAGRLMLELPNARLVVHPRGARHMIDPGRLVAGTEAVYGREQTAALYGRIRPVDPERLDTAADGSRFRLGGRELVILHTEGHARHHYCLHDPASAGVFTGDSFGVSYRDFDTAAGEFIFPTTTPRDFDPVEAHRSVDRIIELSPERLYLTHYSKVTDPAGLAEDMHSGIDAYVAIAETCRNHAEREERMQAAMRDYLTGRLVDHGYRGSREEIGTLLEGDVVLNVQGLIAWLERTGH